MIQPDTIREVQEKADILDVVQYYLPELKRKGASYQACCPFHNEKSPSFNVSPARGIYKCFGCGKGGNAIGFVMEYDKVTFTQAIETLANKYGISIQRDESIDIAELEKLRDAERGRTEALHFAEEWYHNSLMKAPRDTAVWQQLYAREINEPAAVAWRLGWAPDAPKNIADRLINMGRHTAGVDTGLLRINGSVTYDVFQDRLTIPIRNRRGQLTGFGGRALSDKTAAYGKYINPKESEVYDKSRTLFGLHEAEPYIRVMNSVYVVEGYFDVMSLQLVGITNVVAPCGTALTEEHARMLKKCSRHVILMGDGDKPGQESMMKTIDILLAQDLRVEVVVLPAGEDPDTWARKMKKQFTNPEPAEEVEAEENLLPA